MGEWRSGGIEVWRSGVEEWSGGVEEWRSTSGMLSMTWPLAITSAGTPVAAMAEHTAYLRQLLYTNTRHPFHQTWCTGVEEREGRGEREGRVAPPLLADGDLPVPPPPLLGGREHAPAAAHVPKGRLARPGRGVGGICWSEGGACWSEGGAGEVHSGVKEGQGRCMVK